MNRRPTNWPACTPAKAAHLYTAHIAGACPRNPGPGAWAYVLEAPDGATLERAFYETDTTEPRTALAATIAVIEALPPGTPLVVYSSAEYVTKNAELHLDSWRANGWRGSKGKPIKNADLWRELGVLLAEGSNWINLERLPRGAAVSEAQRAHDLAEAAVRDGGE